MERERERDGWIPIFISLSSTSASALIHIGTFAERHVKCGHWFIQKATLRHRVLCQGVSSKWDQSQHIKITRWQEILCDEGFKEGVITLFCLTFQ